MGEHLRVLAYRIRERTASPKLAYQSGDDLLESGVGSLLFKQLERIKNVNTGVNQRGQLT